MRLPDHLASKQGRESVNVLAVEIQPERVLPGPEPAFDGSV